MPARGKGHILTYPHIIADYSLLLLCPSLKSHWFIHVIRGMIKPKDKQPRANHHISSNNSIVRYVAISTDSRIITYLYIPSHPEIHLAIHINVFSAFTKYPNHKQMAYLSKQTAHIRQMTIRKPIGKSVITYKREKGDERYVKICFFAYFSNSFSGINERTNCFIFALKLFLFHDSIYQ